MLRKALHAIILIAFQRETSGEVSPNQKSSVFSRSAYFMTMNNNRLHGYVVERFQSASLLLCNQKCLRREWCTSTNFKAPEQSGKTGTCGLNKHSYSSVFESASLRVEDGVTFSLLVKVTVFKKTIFDDRKKLDITNKRLGIFAKSKLLRKLGFKTDMFDTM